MKLRFNFRVNPHIFSLETLFSRCRKYIFQGKTFLFIDIHHMLSYYCSSILFSRLFIKKKIINRCEQKDYSAKILKSKKLSYTKTIKNIKSNIYR